MMFFSRVAGVPAPQGSKSFKGTFKDKQGRTRARMVESSAKVAPWRSAVTYAVIAAKGDLYFDCAVRLSLEFVMPRTKAMDAPRRKPKPTPHHISTPDLSKLIRCTEDAITDAGLWRDDSRVNEFGAVAKRYAEPGEPTGCLIIIEALPPKEIEHVETQTQRSGRAGRSKRGNRRDAGDELPL
jgi:Holliday junction resolvase RusA-like endonuclease